ncbi:hypothetical protein STRDD11_01077 [Streptococcus sp. DD11]|nr:hypothetical protein STRDD11_01077 [Streptococcus sp. DD11]
MILDCHWGAISVDTSQLYCRCFTLELLIWRKSDIACSVDLKPTDLGNLFHIGSGVKDRRTASWESDLRISNFKCHLALLHLTLQAFGLIPFASRSHFLNRWRVSRRHLRAVLVHTSDRDWIRRTDKLLVWRESDRAIRRHLKNTDIRHFLALGSVIKGRWNIIIQRHSRVSACEAWRTRLRLALRSCAGRSRSVWHDFLHHCLVFDGH